MVTRPVQVAAGAEQLGAGVHFNTLVPWKSRVRQPSRPQTQDFRNALELVFDLSGIT